MRAEDVDCRIDPGQSGDCPLQLVLIQGALVAQGIIDVEMSLHPQLTQVRACHKISVTLEEG